MPAHPSSNPKLYEGLYEQLVNEFVDAGIAEAAKHKLKAELRNLDPGDSHTYLAQYLAQHIGQALASVPETDRLNRQIELANRILVLLAESSPGTFDPDKARLVRAELLLGIFQNPLERPDTPLSLSCLMTGTRHDPSLVSQIRKEILTADRIDILCSFIKWGGVRILEDSLQNFTGSGRPLRIITTSYMGATDLKAVEFLRQLPSSDLRVSYDTRRTRLHAKAYVFHRHSGFGSAYVGSSNLSQAALTDGLEWNVKISQRESPHLWNKVCATFETYWNDHEFVPYNLQSRDRLQRALASERSYASSEIATVFDIQPFPFQQEILDKLAAERIVHGRFRNLVVAATGTGKTVISAFDFSNYRITHEKLYSKPVKLLFVAHREEILKQSLACFRMILRDHNFGDLLVGHFEPQSLDNLFVSIQSFNARSLWDLVRPDHYDFVVIDEFHHAASPSYQRLLEFIQPKVLLGLTATPERMDSLDILHFFEGHIAAEIRLPDAINRKLLCPFQYFGITDSVDYSSLRWQRGGYVIDDLDRLLTGNDVRAQLIISKAEELLLDIRKARALGFCIGVRHAEYMAAVFNRAGIPSLALSSNSPYEVRRSAKERLVSGNLNFVFVVDLYNEGVDIPEVDTILLLRPTESLTIFLQQLGRGLRLHKEKECLTVLDFIGQAHLNFNFEARFRSLVGQTPHRIDDEIEQGLPHLPAGCVVNLERIAAQHILNNIRQATLSSRNRLIKRITTYRIETGKDASLHDFIEYHNLEVDDIYQRGTWSRLQVHAGIAPEFKETDEQRLTKGLRRVAHINSVHQIRALLETLPFSSNEDFTLPIDEVVQRYLLMLHFSLWSRDWCPSTLTESIRRLSSNPTLLKELRDLLGCKLEFIDEIPNDPVLPFLCPLQHHANYTRDEILAATGVWTLESQREVREGVLYLENLRADLFFITLDKTEGDYSPTTMYEDYAINEELFHWQSQSTTSADSPTGRRYIEHVSRNHSILLFVRETKRKNGLAMPYTFLGPADYVAHEGSRPMSITWKLREKIPAKLLRQVRRLAND